MKINYLQNKTVLVIDDTPANLDVLCDFLTTLDVKVLVQTYGESGIKTAMRKQPDIIILDIMMPDVDGYETCRRLKNEPATQAIPVIFTSALNETVDKVRGFEVGGVDYICKPFDVDEVIVRMENAIRLHQKIQQKTAVFLQEQKEKTAVYQFTGRELEIFKLYASGKLRNEIAQQLYISENTVKSHLKSLFFKLNVSSRAQLVDKVHKLGLIKH